VSAGALWHDIKPGKSVLALRRAVKLALTMEFTSFASNSPLWRVG
jgi:hypothetical protein